MEIVDSEDSDEPEVVEVDVVEVIEVSTSSTDSNGPSHKHTEVVDLTHDEQCNLHFAVVRGLVRGALWNGITSCVQCAYSAVRYAPPGASSYVVAARRKKNARTIVEQECGAAQVGVHAGRSVIPDLLDVVMYTDGCVLDGNSKMVREVWMTLHEGIAQAFSGFGVWFAQDCPFNSCGVVPGELNIQRAEFYALCVGLDLVSQHIPWAGRVLVRTDCKMQNCRESSAEYAKRDYVGVSNADLWQRLEKTMQVLEARNTIVIFEWVKAHAMSYGNMCADKLAKAGGLAGLSEAVPYFAERTIRWDRYRPKPVVVPRARANETACFAELNRDVQWKERDKHIADWMQRRVNMESEKCLNVSYSITKKPRTHPHTFKR